MNRRNIHRNEIILWIIVGLFLILLLWKITVTSIDLTVMIAFLLALFSIGISLFFYMKVNALVKELKEIFRSGQSVPQLQVDKQLADKHVDDMSKLDESVASNDELDPTLQIAFEERTLKLKEEERQEILRMLQQTGLDESEKKVYISQLEKVDNDLFNIRSNLNNLRKKINQSFSEMFILEKTKVLREIIDKLGPEFVRREIFSEINDGFKVLKSSLPQSTLDLLDENAYIDSEGNLTRKGYREFIKVARKM